MKTKLLFQEMSEVNKRLERGFSLEINDGLQHERYDDKT